VKNLDEKIRVRTVEELREKYGSTENYVKLFAETGEKFRELCEDMASMLAFVNK